MHASLCFLYRVKIVMIFSKYKRFRLDLPSLKGKRHGVLKFDVQGCYTYPPTRGVHSLPGQEFVGKCLYYQSTLNPQSFTDHKINCSSLWESFRDAVAFQSPCHVDSRRFDKFCNESKHHVPKNKFVLWEHAYETVMRYSNRGKRDFTFADTLTGFLGDTNFCGSNSSSDGVEQDRSKCPGWDQTPECPWSTGAAFWLTASEYYSRAAHGEVEIMLNATSVPFFTNES